MADPQDQPVNFDDLLSLDDDSDQTASDDADDLLEELSAASPETTPQAETSSSVGDEDDERIRELKAALAQPLPKFEATEEETSGPKELTPKQREIQDLEDQLAKRNALIAENAPTQYAPPAKGETILIHIVEDGFIALGEVWFRGQELEFEIGGSAYRQTQDLNGNSWVDIAGDLQAQYQKWGKQRIGLGPFIPRPNEKFEDDVARSDARRKRAVPLARR